MGDRRAASEEPRYARVVVFCAICSKTVGTREHGGWIWFNKRTGIVDSLGWDGFRYVALCKTCQVEPCVPSTL